MQAETWPKRPCIVGILCAALALGWGASREAIGQDLPTPTQNAMAGASVYGEKGCIKCHGAGGEGGSIGPDLRAAAQSRTFQDLSAALWNHLPVMTRRMDELGIQRPRLSTRDAGDLIAYLYTLDYFEPPGDAERGAVLFTEKSCIRCHRVGGIGGVVGPDLDNVGTRGVPIEVATAMWNHSPAMSDAARARGIQRPTLSGPELSDLMAYLESASHGTTAEDLHVLPGRAVQGERVMTEKGCVDCHGSPGTGGRLGPDLQGRARESGLVAFVAAMWNKAPAMAAAAARSGLETPILTPEDVADIVAYLYSVDYFSGAGDPGRGRKLVRSQGCLGCHTLGGSGAGTAPELEGVPGLDLPAAVVAALWNHTVVAQDSVRIPAETWPTFNETQMTDLMAFFLSSAP